MPSNAAPSAAATTAPAAAPLNETAKWALHDVKQSDTKSQTLSATGAAIAGSSSPTRRVAVGKNPDGTMRFYEYSVDLNAAEQEAALNAGAPKPAALVALTTAAVYGANPNPPAHTVLPPKRYLPESKKHKQSPGNTSKLSQVNARPAGSSSNVVALQTQGSLSMVGGTKGEQRFRRFGTGPRTVSGADDGMASFGRVFQSHGIKWKEAMVTDKQHNFRNWHTDPDYSKPPNDHPIRTGWRLK